MHLHDHPSIVAQALASVNRKDVDALAVFWSMESKSYWSASRLYYSMYSAQPRSWLLTDDERASYMLHMANCLGHVDRKSQPGALALEVSTSYRFLFTYSWHEAAGRMASALIAMAELDTTDLHNKDLKALSTAKVAVGCMLGKMLAHEKKPFCLNTIFGQLVSLSLSLPSLYTLIKRRKEPAC